MRRLSLLAIGALCAQSLLGETAGGLNARHVTGGTFATVFDYPAIVLLVGVVQSPRYCTGSLISDTDTWVLTAAHCADCLAPSDIAVSLGWPDYHETRFVEQVVMHDEYDPLDQPGGWAHDLALIEIESAFLSRTTATLSRWRTRWPDCLRSRA